MLVFSLILITVMLNTAAQLLLKAGMNQLGAFSFTAPVLLNSALRVMVNPFIITGLFLYVLSVAFWLLVLSRTEVSYAYPMGSLAYILSAVLAYYWFGENLTPARLIGIAVIIIGVYLVSRT
ncbi:MAG: arnE [Gammaproteobacteria bacterium]|jgi:drug/metabolite transporter (DMT)-like permease|nr:arnE [Gammaproteobacteria bacterium]